MNNLFLKSINNIEREVFLKKILNKKKGSHQNFILRINSYLAQLISLFRTPKYYLPKKHISEAVLKARENIQINGENLKEDDIYDIEKIKVLLRIDLRFKYSQQILLSSFVKQILNSNNSSLDFSDYKWVSPLYPLIHLSNDKSEEGRMHRDIINVGLKGSLVAWLPFSNYEYPGVVKLNDLLGFLTHFSPPQIASRILKFAKSYPIKNMHKAGHWMAWNDTFYHKGLLNSSDKMSIALIIRFSNHFSKETFLPVKELGSQSTGLFFSDNQNDHDMLIKHSKMIAKKLIENSRNEKDHGSFISKTLEILNKNDDLNKGYNANQTLCIFHIVDYALTLFIQRFCNSSINWFVNEKVARTKDILKRLKLSQDCLNKEMYKLTKNLKSSLI